MQCSAMQYRRNSVFFFLRVRNYPPRAPKKSRPSFSAGFSWRRAGNLLLATGTEWAGLCAISPSSSLLRVPTGPGDPAIRAPPPATPPLAHRPRPPAPAQCHDAYGGCTRRRFRVHLRAVRTIARCNIPLARSRCSHRGAAFAPHCNTTQHTRAAHTAFTKTPTPRSRRYPRRRAVAPMRAHYSSNPNTRRTPRTYSGDVAA